MCNVLSSRRSDIAMRQGDHTVLPATHTRTISASVLSRKASLPFGWYSLRLSTKRLTYRGNGWLHTEINVLHRELNPDTITHPSTTHRPNKDVLRRVSFPGRSHWKFSGNPPRYQYLNVKLTKPIPNRNLEPNFKVNLTINK